MATGDDPAIRLIIVDDHQMVAEGLAEALDSTAGINVVGTASSVATAGEVAAATQPDVALVDNRLPDGDGVRAIEAIRSASADTVPLIITAFPDVETAAQAIESRCAGFLSKNASLEELRAAVLSAAAGEVLFSQDVIATLVGRLREPSDGVGQRLTVREMAVLRQLALGRGTDQMADALYLSPYTVRNHVQRILMKLDAHSKLEAVVIALRTGVLEFDDL